MAAVAMLAEVGVMEWLWGCGGGGDGGNGSGWNAAVLLSVVMGQHCGW